MIALTQITNTEAFAFIAAVVLKLLSRKVLFYEQKRQQKLLKSRLRFKKIANFTGELLKNYKKLDTFKTRKRLFIGAFSIFMTVPLITPKR